MQKTISSILLAATLIATSLAAESPAGEDLRNCLLTRRPPCGVDQPAGSHRISCGIELTCTDKAMQLGYLDGVCFRATCPGIWALMHKRIDQASFRRRYFTYRHYGFNGTWQLKTQGSIESVPAPSRELFLVLPDDLIEFRLQDPDTNTRVEIINLGYIRKGTIGELKHWLAYNTYLENPVSPVPKAVTYDKHDRGQSHPPRGLGALDLITRPVHYIRRILGLDCHSVMH